MTWTVTSFDPEYTRQQMIRANVEREVGARAAALEERAAAHTDAAPAPARPGLFARLRRKLGLGALVAGLALGSAGAAGAFDGHVSGVAAVQGYEGSDWHSDVAVFNDGPSAATVRLTYAPKGTSPDSGSFVPVTVGPQ